MELKLLLSYDIKLNRETEYYRYVLSEFIPSMQSLGLMLVEGWHTAYGNYPLRLMAFRADDDTDMQNALKSKGWQEAKEKLLKLVRNYEEQLVPAKNRFQFFRPTRPQND